MYIAYYTENDKIVTVNDLGNFDRSHYNTNNIRMVLVNENLIENCQKKIKETSDCLEHLKMSERKRMINHNMHSLVILIIGISSILLSFPYLLYLLIILFGVETSLTIYHLNKKNKAKKKMTDLSNVIEMANIKEKEFKDNIKKLKSEGILNYSTNKSIVRVDDLKNREELNNLFCNIYNENIVHKKKIKTLKKTRNYWTK